MKKVLKFITEASDILSPKNIEEFVTGFLFLVLANFFWSASIEVIKNPLSISEGTAILYIAVLTGLYYSFTKKTDGTTVSGYAFAEKPIFTIARTLGIILYACLHLLALH